MPSPIPPDHFRVIAAHIPGVIAGDIEMNTSGNDHIVYFVRRQTTFRFPRIPRHINPTRKNFLDAFARISPIPVPLITIERDERTDSDYEVNAYLPGIPFEPAVASALSTDQLHGVAGDLGAFLSALHAFSLDTARALGVDELDPATFGAYMAENPSAYPHYRHMVFPYLTAQEQRWLERLFGDYIAHVKDHPFTVRVTHADMWPYHILVDPLSAKLTGVLDYWPRISDPANDFKAFERYGTDFISAVYQRYILPRDESFELRRLFYAGRDEVAELARAIERRDTRRIAVRHQLLVKYITEHTNSLNSR